MQNRPAKADSESIKPNSTQGERLSQKIKTPLPNVNEKQTKRQKRKPSEFVAKS
jgi:hypothetical protein